MKIILMDDVPALGRRGEVRDVSDGYARNYLLPHKLALHATTANLKNLEQIKTSQDAAAAKLTAQAQEQARAIEALHFTQARQAPLRLHRQGGYRRVPLPTRGRGRAAADRAGRAHQERG